MAHPHFSLSTYNSITLGNLAKKLNFFLFSLRLVLIQGSTRLNTIPPTGLSAPIKLISFTILIIVSLMHIQEFEEYTVAPFEISFNELRKE